MTKKLEGNGLWESSRMMLPEHKEAILERWKKITKKNRPSLDDQRLQELSRLITEAVESQSGVELTLHDPLENPFVHGTIQQVNKEQRKVKLVDGKNVMWIPFEDIMEISLL